ncbi:hypothetical protein P9112_009032 [Eukaryota sp. TZLM1-RC]
MLDFLIVTEDNSAVRTSLNDSSDVFLKKDSPHEPRRSIVDMIRARRAFQLKLIHASNRHKGILLRRSMKCNIRNRRVSNIVQRTNETNEQRTRQMKETMMKRHVEAAQRRASMRETMKTRLQAHHELVAKRREAFVGARRRTKRRAFLNKLMLKRNPKQLDIPNKIQIPQVEHCCCPSAFFVPTGYQDQLKMDNARKRVVKNLSRRRSWFY